jgi:hypothetical protein
MQPLSLLGPIDVLEPYAGFVVFGLVLVNMLTRILASRNYEKQAKDDDTETLSRWIPHEVSNVLLVLSAFYFLTLHHHGGIVLSTLVLGLVITDFFEVEARSVELRRGLPLEKPKAAVLASVLVLMYIGYETVFFIIKPFWSSIV